MADYPQILDVSVDGLVHQFSVAVDYEKVVQLVNERLRNVQKTARIKGFRPGKAPLKIVRSHHGAKITNAIVDRLAIDVTRNIIVEKALQPIGRPIIDIVNEGEEDNDRFRFTLTLEVFPQVTLKSIEAFKIERLMVMPNEITSEIEKLSRQHVKRQIFDKLVADYDFPVPSEMARREHQRIRQTYLETIDDHIPIDLDKEFQEIAERRIQLAILLVEVGRVHNIQIPRDEVERLVETQAEREPEHETEIVNYYLDHPTALAELQSTLFEDRVTDLILKHALVDECEVTSDELIAAGEVK